MRPLKHALDADVPNGVDLYFWGGYSAGETQPGENGAWKIVLASAGEDGFGSVQDGADALAAALRAAPGAITIV